MLFQKPHFMGLPEGVQLPPPPLTSLESKVSQGPESAKKCDSGLFCAFFGYQGVFLLFDELRSDDDFGISPFYLDFGGKSYGIYHSYLEYEPPTSSPT